MTQNTFNSEALEIESPIKSNRKNSAPTSAPTAHETATKSSLDTEEVLMMGAKTLAGIGLGFVVVALGATGVGALLEATIIPTALAKTAGALAGGGIGLSKSITDFRKERERKRRSSLPQSSTWH